MKSSAPQGSYQSESGFSSSNFSRLLLMSGLSALGAVTAYYFYRRFDNKSYVEVKNGNADVKMVSVVEGPTQKSSPVSSQSGSPVVSNQSCLSTSSFHRAKTPIPNKDVSSGLNEQKYGILDVHKQVEEDNLQSKQVEAPVLTAQAFLLSPSTSSSMLSPLPSMCRCRESHEPSKILTDSEAVFTENLRFEGLLMKLKPFNFQKYEPFNLVIMSDEEVANGLSSASRELEYPAEENLFTAFNPVLRCIVYASKHSMLLDALVKDYAFLGET